MVKKKKGNNKNAILVRYFIVVAGFLFLTALIVIALVKTTVVEAPLWNERAKKELSRIDTIAPERGNLLADNGNILACNLKVYDVKIDLRHAKILNMKMLNWAKIDSLADSLDAYYPKIKNLNQHPDTFAKYSWHTRLKKEFDKDPGKRTRALLIARKKTLHDYERIRNFPFIKDFKGRGYRVPIYTEIRKIRMYPYGKMAFRSIGRVNENQATGEIHGYSGLEKDLDKILYGKPGFAKKVAMTNGIGSWVTTPPQRGLDIVTTIDIDIQDMLEEELLEVCEEVSAEWGTAIIMEVATGEIKAISNIEKLDDGTYGEALNRAVLPFEPGSVIKPISLMIAFEDGLVKSVNDIVDTSPFQGTRDPHGSTMKNMKQVIEMSSNTGIARVLFRGYASDPSKYYDRLESIGFFEPLNTGIAGECVPRVKKLLPKDSRGYNITMTARHLDLARQTFGYNTEVPPIYTLALYNAIANKGRFVRPHLVKEYIYEDGRDSILPIDYIRDPVCSPETAEKVKQCIHEVVWGDHGTARKVRDDRVKIVGKTGTVYPVEGGTYNKSKRRYAFTGFFPYEEPKYSCMALVLASSGTSANRTSGQVVKNVAVKLYSRGMLGNSSTYTTTRDNSRPVAATANPEHSERLASTLRIPGLKRIRTEQPRGNATVPNVVGYDVQSAVKLLEERGLNVKVMGSGHVVQQSLLPGRTIRKGDNITLVLRM